MSAILFGSIGSLSDTSELQRLSLNEAFRQFGLSWSWSRHQYMDLLRESDERKQIAAYGAQLGQPVDAEAISQLKSHVFRQAMMTYGLESRAGVMETIRRARKTSCQLALVTTEEQETVRALLSALGPQVKPEDFDCIIVAEEVQAAKPAPEAYWLAMQRLGISADDAIAIEDNLDGLSAARTAGLDCVAFPGSLTSAHGFVGAVLRRRELDFATLAEQLGGELREKSEVVRLPLGLSAA